MSKAEVLMALWHDLDSKYKIRNMKTNEHSLIECIIELQPGYRLDIRQGNDRDLTEVKLVLYDAIGEGLAWHTELQKFIIDTSDFSKFISTFVFDDSDTKKRIIEYDQTIIPYVDTNDVLIDRRNSIQHKLKTHLCDKHKYKVHRSANTIDNGNYIEFSKPTGGNTTTTFSFSNSNSGNPIVTVKSGFSVEFPFVDALEFLSAPNSPEILKYSKAV